MIYRKLKKKAMGIVNQLFDLVEVPVEKRQEVNDKADEYMVEQLMLHNVSNCVDEEKVLVDRNTLQWLYNYVKKDRDSDEKTAIIKHLESLGCVY